MHRRLMFPLSVLGLALVLSACSDLPAAPAQTQRPWLAVASSALVSQGTGETSFAGLTFTCAGEPVNMAGTVVFRWHITQLAAGDWMLTQHEVTSAEGVGTISGDRYWGHGTTDVTQVFAAPYQGAFTYTQVARMVGIVQGSADDSVFRLHAKWTINSVGEVTVDIFKVEVECRG